MQQKPGKSAGRKRKIHAPSAHQVRIIGGQWKRTPLAVPDAEGLRPTPDRVRETVFNWLNHLLNGAWDRVACLDLFAGTGALGFEAASRGAARVVMVEANPAAVRLLQATQDKLHALQVSILRGDAGAIALGMLDGLGDLRLDEKRFQVIFLDPPYHQDWLVKLLPTCARLLAEDGFLYAEAEQAFDDNFPQEWMNEWQVIKADKAGKVFYHLLQRKRSLKFQA
ncbi:MAG: 16S rRNA (guanine(966)-N(2))-methyltransferase RsmD [Burkholderiales bacterium]